MKRFLLFFVCATMMIAANATNFSKKFNPAPTTSIKFVKGNMMNQLVKPMATSAMQGAVTSTANNAPAKSFKAAKAAATESDFAGAWVSEFTEDMTDDCGEAFNVVNPSSIKTEVENDTLWVEITGALEYADLYGYYDPEASTVTIPAQYCYEHDSYGKFAFFGVAEDGESLEYEYVLNVAADENGHLSMVNEDMAWAILMMEGDYEGYTWQYGESLAFNKCNFRFYEAECHIENSAWTNWAEDSCDVYVESIEDDIFVHGMWGTTISMSYNSDTNYYEIANKQPVTYGYLSSSKSYFAFYTYNCGVDDEGYLTVPMDDDFLPDEDFTLNAYVSTSGYLVFGTPTEESVDWDYFYIAKFISDSRGYFKGVHCAYYCAPLTDVEEGINTVNATSAKSNAMYNIAGQQVSKNYKGIVINNGKKYLNK